MSTYYDFMAEAFFDGAWHNIDYFTMKLDGTFKHHLMCSISRSFLGLLEDAVHEASELDFSELSPNTQQIILSEYSPECRDSAREGKYYAIYDIDGLRKLAQSRWEHEHFVTRYQIERYEQSGEEIDEWLTAHEVLELPAGARSEYVLYRWNSVESHTEQIRDMISRLDHQIELFEESIPWRSAMRYEDHHVMRSRLVFTIS